MGVRDVILFTAVAPTASNTVCLHMQMSVYAYGINGGTLLTTQRKEVVLFSLQIRNQQHREELNACFKVTARTAARLGWCLWDDSQPAGLRRWAVGVYAERN